jgi:hypothetical protein
MKVEKQTVWSDDKGRELIVQKGPNKFFIPLTSVSRDEVIALRDACVDVIASTPAVTEEK